MPKMIPPYINGRIENYGESRVFELLKNTPDAEDWIILHSYNLPNIATSIGREIDFLALIPHKGIFILEVKNGEAIQRDNGTWIIKDKFGNNYESEEGPFNQARNAMYSLKNTIKKWCGSNNKFNNILFTYGVVFPEAAFNYSDMEIEKWRVYDSNTICNIKDYFDILFENSLKSYRNYDWFSESESLPGKKEVEELFRQLRGSFEFNETFNEKVNKIDRRLNKFTDEQYFCLDGLEENDRCLFKGAAGTGKTMIAIEAVKRSIASGQNTLIICYNKLLSTWINFQLMNYSLDGKYQAVAFLDYLEDLTTKYGYAKSQSKSEQEYYNEDLPLYALEVLEKYPFEKFDKVIIDEGQDLINDSYLEVIDNLLNGGLKNGKWNIFCDFERQNIFNEQLSSSQMLDLLKSKASFATYKLTVNCRNTREIADEIKEISGFNYKKYLNPELSGIPVEYIYYENEDEEIIKLEEILKDLKKKGIPQSDVTILGSHKMNNSCLVKFLKSRPHFSMINLSENHERFLTRKKDDYTFSTIHKFKGMENLYIIITDINKIEDTENFKNLLYVGMSRTKVGLVVLMSKKVKK